MLKNLNIRTRLILGTIAMALTLLLVGAIGYNGIKHMEGIIYAMDEGGEKSTEHLSTLSYLYDTNVFDVIQKVQNGNLSWLKGHKQIKKARERISQQVQLYLKTGLNKEQQVIAEQLNSLIKKADENLDKLQEIMHREDQTEFSAFTNKEIFPTIEPIIELLYKLTLKHATDTRQEFLEGIKLASLVTKRIVIVSIISIIFAICGALYIISTINKPLSFAIDTINKVATGDTSLDYTIHSYDEIGQLLVAMKKMIKSEENMANATEKIANGEINIDLDVRSNKDTLGHALKHMIYSAEEMAKVIAKIAKGDLRVDLQPRSENDVLGNALKLMVEHLRETIAQIQAEVQVLTSSNQEILASITQASTTTTETATAVTETTATVEELKQTAQVSTEKAQDVLSNSETTLAVVKSSQVSVNATINDMNQIQDKMTIISESITQLSQHSLAIGEIINTVNDLAEQSNLLAVNAAIEAAKAGDQGKSFGVVAQEIRILAEQSKTATVQVRAILNDIQNATSAAVMATEQGSKAVLKGVSQSSQTNAEIQSLSVNMAQVSQAARQITISSQQQLIAVQQVTVAMANINQASNQHVEHMRQIEEAIQALNEVGRTLKDLTDQYQLIKEEAKKKDYKQI